MKKNAYPNRIEAEYLAALQLEADPPAALNFPY